MDQEVTFAGSSSTSAVLTPTESNSWLERIWTPLAELLIEDGFLAEDQERAFMEEWAEEAWIPLGTILIRDRLLSISQVSKLLGIQLDEPEAQIGALAVREGFCTSEQIQRALKKQRTLLVHPLEFARRKLGLEAEELWETLLAHLSELELRNVDRG